MPIYKVTFEKRGIVRTVRVKSRNSGFAMAKVKREHNVSVDSIIQVERVESRWCGLIFPLTAIVGYVFIVNF